MFLDTVHYYGIKCIQPRASIKLTESSPKRSITRNNNNNNNKNNNKNSNKMMRQRIVVNSIYLYILAFLLFIHQESAFGFSLLLSKTSSSSSSQWKEKKTVKESRTIATTITSRNLLSCCRSSRHDENNDISASSSVSTSNRRTTTTTSSSSSTSINFAMDPTSVEAKEIIRNHLGLSSKQHQQLAKLAVLVNDWNDRINLISRKDCSTEVVFGRHILPSLAPIGLFSSSNSDDDDDNNDNNNNGIDSVLDIKNCKQIVDVGTGGGFPGLPLAIAYPQIEFTLVDSVGKKLTAVQDMADKLDLSNVQIHHGRAEELTDKKFDVCVGRSVAAIPTYCFWIQNLLNKSTGRLVYLIGGDIEQHLLDQTIVDVDIDVLLDCDGASDKRVLIFNQASVKKIAASSGEKNRLPTKKNRNNMALGGKNKPKRLRSKGEWNRRDNSQTKQRGYEGFKRYDNLNP